MVVANAKQPSQAGFSLIELMVAIAIISVLAGVALPSFNSFVASQRIKAASFELMSALQYARSEAIKRNTNVSVVAEDTWEDGWRVEVGGDVLLRHEKLKGTLISGLQDTADERVVTYNRSGRITELITSGEIASEKTEYSAMNRCILIDATGLPRSASKTGSSC